ncbi:MAG: hypothetical protein JNM55_06330 [Anaerolineales bacterium]|nr:hypothetical protein [Anaerolineales bacterium]
MDDDEPLSDENEFGIDPEQLLQSLLSLSGDDELRLDVVEKLAQRMGLPPEKADLLMRATIEYLKNQSGSDEKA